MRLLRSSRRLTVAAAASEASPLHAGLGVGEPHLAPKILISVDRFRVARSRVGRTLGHAHGSPFLNMTLDATNAMMTRLCSNIALPGHSVRFGSPYIECPPKPLSFPLSKSA